MVDCLFALIELFLLSVTVLELRGEMYMHGVDLFALKFYLDRVVLH